MSFNPKKTSFNQAVQKMQEGQCMRRSAWDGAKYVAAIKDGENWAAITLFGGKESSLWRPEAEDMQALDWEVAHEL